MASCGWRLGVAAVELAVADDAFGLRADVDEDLVLVDPDDGALDDVAVLEALDVRVLLGEELLHRRRLGAEVADRRVRLRARRPRRARRRRRTRRRTSSDAEAASAARGRSTASSAERSRRRRPRALRRQRAPRAVGGRRSAVGGGASAHRRAASAAAARDASAVPRRRCSASARRRRRSASTRPPGRLRRRGVGLGAAAADGLGRVGCVVGRDDGCVVRGLGGWLGGGLVGDGYGRRGRCGRLVGRPRRSPRAPARSRPAVLRSSVVSLLFTHRPRKTPTAWAAPRPCPKRRDVVRGDWPAVRSFARKWLDVSSAVLPSGAGRV